MNALTHNPHAKLTLVVGGTRSGKSTYAEQIAASFGKKILYIATAEVWPGAGSLEYRVKKHRERRFADWITYECPRDVATHLRESGLLAEVDGVILECLTLLTSNVLYAQTNPAEFEPFLQALLKEISDLQALIAESSVPWVIVSSETNMGITPIDSESRHYCDALGIANQLLAKSADKVYLMFCGIPLTLKGGEA